MGMGNLVVLTQITCYLFALIFSFFTFPPIAASQADFDDHCILYSTGEKNATKDRYVVNWSDGSQCGFTIFIGIVLFGISLWQTIRLSVHAVAGTDSSFLMTCITLLFNLLLDIMLLASAITVTQGYQMWCQYIRQSGEYSCEDAGYALNFFEDEKIRPQGFAIDWGIAQFGLWSAWIMYTILVIISFNKIYKLHKQENILRSLTRERQRLLGHYEQPDI